MSESASDRDRNKAQIGFIALAGHDWNDQWLGKQQVMSRLAKRYHVVWFGPSHEWRDIPQRLLAGPSVGNPLAD